MSTFIEPSLGGLASPTLVGLFQVLPVLSSFKHRKDLARLINVRSLAAVVLGGLIWKASEHFQVKRLLWRLIEGSAVVEDEVLVYRWIFYFLKTHPRFRSSPREVELIAPEETTSRSITASTTSKDCKSVREDEMRNKEDLNKYFVPGRNLTMYFVFQGTLFRASTDQRISQAGQTHKSIHLTYWSFSTIALHRLVDRAEQLYMAHRKEKAKVSVYRIDKYGHWSMTRSANKRTLDTLHLPGMLKQDIWQDAKTFFSDEGMHQHAKRSIPYRRGFLFWGPPGNGKSSLCQVLASELGEPLYILDLNSSDMTDSRFLSAMSHLPSRCIVLIEDVDVAFVNRDEAEGTVMTKSKSSVSFSSLLNGIDGIDAPTGRLLCMTTNYIDSLDAALKRPGRADRQFEVKNATKEQAKELFKRWFKEESESDSGAATKLEGQADTFAQSIPDGKYSVAALQGCLMRFGDDSQKAVEGVQMWMQKQPGEKKAQIGSNGEKHRVEEGKADDGEDSE